MTNHKLKLNDVVIPCIPFLWYREEELICPIEYIGLCNKEKLGINIDDDIHLIVQRNVLENQNIYVCLHSLMYYHLHKNLIKEGKIKKIPSNFNCDRNFDVKLVSINADLEEVPNGLKNNQFVSGSVFIHDAAFSPPGCLHFKVNEEQEVHKILMYIKSPILGIHETIKCFFILFNDMKNNKNLDQVIKDTLDNFV